ncbi:tripartite tricarboxylate transporter substrate binding protein [Achromobacter sp. GG226]|uniref:Bug family tripartite tricarboxylate transporter substrate binding protein n=1 Tax=Verticiella alkaliphila TaxID=2779529 RepID=UPI001C0D67C8|nr:tripartite tricarboxylate transporter substrate binding protein [Verticiella sp. GG226]MBU4611497.1 tripartite tricarboxylate transporter substrate binding protein [Verticiella sp. GG226]
MKNIALACALAACAVITPVHAQKSYPEKPVRVIVGFPPGQATDEITRRLAQRLGENMGQPFVVENRPGSGASMAAELVARAQPDGYTLLASSSGPLTINGWIYTSLRYDPKTDFAPIAPISAAPLVLVVNAASSYQTAQGFIESAKAAPGDLNYGSGGNGVTNHLVMEMLMDAAGLDIAHVPYKGGVAAMSDLVGNQIDAMFEVVSVADPLIKQGRLRALAVSGEERVSILPDVPTLQELGYPVRGVPWSGILAPVGTPPGILDALHREISAIVDSPQWQAETRQRGSTTLRMSRQAFADFIAADIERWGVAVREAGVQLN